MFICKLCNKELGPKGISSHLRRQHNITNKEYYDKYLKKDNEGYCKICNKPTKFNTILEGYHVYCSSKCVNLDSEVRNKIENTNLDRYGAKGNFGRKDIIKKAVEHSQSKEAKQQRAKTNLDRYGAENPYASKIIIDKMKQYNLDNYGVEYSWQRTDVKNKIKETCIEKYGSDSHMQSKQFIEKLKKDKVQQQVNFSKENDCVSRSDVILQYGNGWIRPEANLNIQYLYCRGKAYIKKSDISKIKAYASINHYQTSHFEQEVLSYIKQIYKGTIKENDRTIISPYELDIVIPEKKIAIECDGTYWHCSDRKGNQYHLFKTKLCLDKGYRLIHIFEYEWLNYQNICKSILTNSLGLSNPIYARQCKVNEVSSEEAKIFLNTNHLQGYIASKSYYGLYYNNELIQLLSIRKSRFKDEMEITRFCTKLNYNVIGGFSKLLKYQPYTNLISYVDRSKYTGEGYKKVGFTFIHETKPSYVYWKNGTILNRLSAQKHKLPKLLGSNYDPTKTESTNMMDAGYLQIYDCGTLKYSYTK